MPGKLTPIIKSSNNLIIAFKKEPLIKPQIAKPWQSFLKRCLDIIVSVIGLVFLTPLFLFISIRIKLDSIGPVFYFQERIGFNGIPFIIFKFRSMYENAEKDGPALSHVNDLRVTNWGSIMRKWKLDELPQLLNVLIGDMSLVGPRPERKFYVDKVSETYPYFKYIHQVKPGLTSVGMVKFGYAENLEQIVKRMKFDISYIENYSLSLDIQVLFFTLPAIAEGKILRNSTRFRTSVQRAKLQILN